MKKAVFAQKTVILHTCTFGCWNFGVTCRLQPQPLRDEMLNREKSMWQFYGFKNIFIPDNST